MVGLHPLFVTYHNENYLISWPINLNFYVLQYFLESLASALVFISSLFCRMICIASKKFH